MDVVYYSLACDHDGVREHQWVRSVCSLRRHNPNVDVVLCLYGGARPETLDVARRSSVHVERMGDYAAALGDLPTHWRAALSTYPPLQKFVSLCHFASTPLTRLLYVDCDTYFFADPATLLARYSNCQWYGREEPSSRRSHHGYDPTYLDEEALARIARAEGLVLIPPYNTGVAVVAGDLVPALAAIREDFHWYSWRLLLGACLWRPEVVQDRSLVAFVRERSDARERRLALPYPSANVWVLEQIATWLTLGRVPHLTHDLLHRGDVVQNGEYLGARDYMLAHYFTGGEAAFVAQLERIGEAA